MPHYFKYLLGLLLISQTVAVALGAAPPRAGIKRSVFGKMPDGQEIHLYTLTNARGMQVGITNYGARIVSIVAPDRHGNMTDVVLGFDYLEG
ncbi:MAG: galactose-1-epimerase, partial [Terriglobia bacterium]